MSCMDFALRALEERDENARRQPRKMDARHRSMRDSNESESSNKK